MHAKKLIQTYNIQYMNSKIYKNTCLFLFSSIRMYDNNYFI